MTAGKGRNKGEMMQKFLKNIAEAKWFQNTITIVILLAGVIVGIETYQEFAAKHHGILNVLDNLIIWIFVAEVLIKMGAEGKRPWRYFFDPWNIFDFLIVAACFMPVDAQYIMVLRLARLLRVLKLVRALPKLQVLVGALLKSIPSMAYVSVLLMLLFYVYGVAATFMFSANDPVHFETLPRSIESLFRVVTLEDWTDVMYINQFGCDKYGYDSSPALAAQCVAPEAFSFGSPIVFISLVMLGTMIILNLFIGVIMNGMEAAQQEREKMDRKEKRDTLGDDAPSLGDEIGTLVREMETIQKRLHHLQKRAVNGAP